MYWYRRIEEDSECHKLVSSIVLPHFYSFSMRPTCYVCIGVSEQMIMNIKKEAISAGSAFRSPAKQYRLSRRRALVDTFDWEAIRRKVYQLYEAKEHMTLSKLLVTSHVKVIETFAKALFAI